MKEDYLPSDVKFDISEQYGFPPVIFEEFDNIEDVRQAIGTKLIAIQEKDTVAVRLLDEYEKESIRDEYQVLLESKKPRLSGELETIIAECKTKIKIPVGEHYLYYTWVNDKFKLAAIRIIPTWEKNDVFNSSVKNAEFFKELYGVETSILPAPTEETPVEIIEEVDAEEAE